MQFKNEIKAIGFDVGHTLIKYNNPLNWQGLYRSGWGACCSCCQCYFVRGYDSCSNRCTSEV